jgi:UDP-GlcNAc:undecaprenyl-phosphate GlcNAc-1-phosphate transferase
MNILYSFLTSFFISFFALPSIIKIAHLKNLTDDPSHRKNHVDKTPTLGGVAIFASLIFSLSFWVRNPDFFEMKYFLSSLIIMFFVGIKDDLYNLVSYKKLIAQLIAALILVHYGDVRLTSMYRFFGVQDIPLWLSYPFSIFTITVIINAFNLIDGVDCLAAGVASVICLFFGIWYGLVGYNALALMSFVLLGALLAFLYYNRPPAKIFLGDTGSLLIGLVIALLSIRFIEYNKVNDSPYHISSVPAVAIGILMIPLFDLARVFFLRIKEGKSPLDADRNHLHHRLLALGMSPLQVSLTLSLATAFFTIYGVLLCKMRGEILLLSMFGIAIALSFWIEKKYQAKEFKHSMT